MTTVYTKSQQLLLDDGCPEFLIITPEREAARKKARESTQTTVQQTRRTDYLAEARRLHLPWVVGVVNPSIPRSTISPRISPSSSFAQTTATWL